MNRFLSIIILVSIVILSSCADNVSNSLSPSASSPSSNLSSEVEARAIGILNKGEILVIPKSIETTEQLGAPSCLGKEADYEFTSDYDVTFKSAEGEEYLIQNLNIKKFIAPNNKQIDLPTLNFKDFQVVVLAPQYTDCHGIAFYLIGTKGNKAFTFKFKTNEGTFDSFNYAPNTQLKVANNQLIIEPGQAAGDEESRQLIFKPNIQSETMQLVES